MHRQKVRFHHRTKQRLQFGCSYLVTTQEVTRQLQQDWADPASKVRGGAIPVIIGIIAGSL